MIRIDSDTHFTPLDAFAGLDLKYAEQGPHRRRLAHGPLSDRLSGARTVRASAHQTAARQTCSGLSSQDFDNLLGSTAAEFFALPGGLKKNFYAPRRQLFQTRPRRREKITWRHGHRRPCSVLKFPSFCADDVPVIVVLDCPLSPVTRP